MKLDIECKRLYSDLIYNLPETNKPREFYGEFLLSAIKEKLNCIKFNPNLVSLSMEVGKYA